MMSDFATARQKMVDGQVRPADVTDLRIIDAMLAIPREAFVPEGVRPMAYLDFDLDVTEGREPRRCLLKPAVLARLLQAAAISENDHVLVAGCASGYSAAVVARLANRVIATEADGGLAVQAMEALAATGAGNVVVTHAAPADGDAANGPYDVILLDGATALAPESLYRQLKPGGRLVGVFAATAPPRAMIVTRTATDFANRILFDASAAILPGLERPKTFVF